MLCRLHVIHYALIDDAEIELCPGLNIITGETGAGKSILIGALGLVLGMRASSEVIRTGEEKCVVEAIFELQQNHPCRDLLIKMGIEADNGELILRREVFVEGRSRCYVNGLSVPVRSLFALGRSLVDLHGQHEHQSLLDLDRHVDFLDGFARLMGLRRKVEANYMRLIGLQDQFVEQQSLLRRKQERQDLLSFQVEEISSLDFHVEEEECLEGELSVLSNAERLIEVSVQLEELLYEGEDSIADQFGLACQLLREGVQLDRSLNTLAAELNDLRYGVEGLARAFSDYAQRIENNPERLAEITDRLELLRGVKKKYGGSLEAVLLYRDKALKELTLSRKIEISLNKIKAEIQVVRDEFSNFCLELSKARKKAASRLSSAIRSSLRELGMPNVKFQVTLDRKESPEGDVIIDGKRFEAGPKGIEQAIFYLSTNPGEEARPLTKVASGGEISRIMLAMKTVLAHNDSIQVLIFDEIDIGISGRIAEVVGRRLKGLSESIQTVSITHLPQIAKMADRHFSVWKETEEGRTVTQVEGLEGDKRTAELAKLLGGEEISPLTLQHAKEMLKNP